MHAQSHRGVPHRAGCDADTAALLREFDAVLYISCNPETLHANLEQLKETHAIRRFAIFDQFPYTDHIECGVYLQRKP
jgi:tRNA (uracil-5-)-methyltransferase